MDKEIVDVESQSLDMVEAEFINIKQSTVRSVEGGHIELQQVGALGGGLASVRPDDLAALVIRTLLARNELDSALIEEVYLGCANQAGEDNRNVARMATLLAGLPVEVALLASFKQEANGKLRLTSQDVWTDANTKSASAAGVVPLTMGAESAYLGIVASQDGRKESLSHLRPEWEAALEFDLARAIPRVNRPPPTPVSAADIALAEKAAESIPRSIPNLASVSVEEGERILRKAALEEYMTAVAEMEREVKEAQQRVIKAEAAGSEADRQSALEQLRQVQKKHADNLGQITARAQAQIEALQRLKRP